MDNIQLQQILQKAYQETFLSRMEFLVEQDKDYKKTEFFKITKISLFDLYDKYETYMKNSNMIIDEFNAFIEKINVDLVTKKLVEFLDKLGEEKKIVDMLEEIIERFSTEKISDYANKIQEELTKIKI